MNDTHDDRMQNGNHSAVGGENKESVGMYHPAGAKESEGIRISAVELPIDGVGVETELPTEVQEAGVESRPQTVELPAHIEKAGVQSVGHNVPVPHRPTAHIPLSDQQIVEGLSKGWEDSFMWLAQWCKRQLDKISASKAEQQT